MESNESFLRLSKDIESIIATYVKLTIKGDSNVKTDRLAFIISSALCPFFSDTVFYYKGSWYEYDKVSWKKSNTPVSIIDYIVNRLGIGSLLDNAEKTEKKHIARVILRLKDTRLIELVIASLRESMNKDSIVVNKDIITFNDSTYDLTINNKRPSLASDYSMVTTGYETTNVSPNTKARMEKYLKEIMPDTDTRNYLVNSLSKSLNGYKKDKVLVFHNVTGSSGVYTFLQFISKVFGGYFNENITIVRNPESIDINLISNLLNKRNEFGVYSRPIIVCDTLPDPRIYRDIHWDKLLVIPWEARFTDSLNLKTDIKRHQSILEELGRLPMEFMRLLLSDYYETRLVSRKIKLATSNYKETATLHSFYGKMCSTDESLFCSITDVMESLDSFCDSMYRKRVKPEDAITFLRDKGHTIESYNIDELDINVESQALTKSESE